MAIQKITTPIIGDAAVTTDKINNNFVTSVTTNPEFQGTSHIKVPAGTTEQRPESPEAGMIRYNTTTGFAEVYDGNIWAEFGAPPPSISTVTPSTYNGESGTSFTINGANFTSDATVFFVTSGGTEVQAGTVAYVNSAQLVATTPQDFTVADEPLDVKVVQASGQITKVDVIDCGGTPSWTTASGTLDTKYEGEAVSATIAATDPDDGATLSYSVPTGLPSGVTINSSTGVISGNTPTNISNDTTYTFNAVATDNAGNTGTRSFSIIIKNDPILDTTTLAAYDGTSGTSSVNGYTLGLNQITANYNTGLSSITGGTWRGTGLFRLPVGSLPGQWTNVVSALPTSGGVTLCFWGTLDGSISSTNTTPRPVDFYSRSGEFMDFNRNTTQFNFTGGNVNARTITGNSSWSMFDWHFYCIRYSVSPVSTNSQTQIVTVDNAGSLYSGSFTSTKSGSNANMSGFMGYQQTNSSEYAWEGYTGGWRVITKNCTDAEVTALYNDGKGYFRP